MPLKKVKTGIEGLDKLLNGGFLEGRVYLVAGEAGTGKTVFALQYIYTGSLSGEPGVYVTIDEKPEHVVENAALLGWNLERLIDENRLLLLELTPYFSDVKHINARRIVEELKTALEEIGAKRLAIDPIAPLVIRSEEPISHEFAHAYIRDYLREIFRGLEDLGVTTVVTSEVPTGSSALSRYGVEEFLASGVIVLMLRRVEMNFRRELYIRKMRGINHPMNVYPFVILKGKGIVIPILTGT